MRDGREVETRRDRKALARHAGMGRISAISVLAGALCGLATVEILLALAGAIGVGINGGTSFAAMGERQFKSVTGVILVVAVFCAFMLGGYVSGRMSRRSGGSHGLLAGITGVILGTIAVAAVIRTGADTGLARVARHIQVADTGTQWRSFGFLAAVLAVAAMVLGGLTGGIGGERWHGKLLSRAVDPSYGPEAEEQAAARKSLTESEVARLAAAERVGHVTAATKALETATTPAPVADRPLTQPAPAEGTRLPGRAAGIAKAAGPRARATNADTGPNPEVDTSRHRRPRHLLGRH